MGSSHIDNGKYRIERFKNFTKISVYNLKNLKKFRGGNYGGNIQFNLSTTLNDIYEEWELVDFILQNFLMIFPNADEKDKKLYESLYSRWKFYNEN